MANASASPSGPSVYQEALALLASPYATVGDVATLLSRDKTLTARLLRQINSAQFGLARRITDAAEAACLLGFERIKSLVRDSEAHEALPTRRSDLLLNRLPSVQGTSAPSHLNLQPR